MKKFIFIWYIPVGLLIAHCSLQIVNAQQPTEEWVARYNSPHSENDRFKDMAVDKQGNSYLTGWNNDSTTGNDIITVKVNNSGQIIWSRVYNSGGAGSNDFGNCITVDESGNVYVAGSIGLNFGPYNIIIIKYDSLGSIKWVKTYDSGADDAALDITHDKLNYVYVTGTSNYRGIVIKYNDLGDTVWVRSFNDTGTRSESYYIYPDMMNNIYIIGGVRLANWMSYVLKYDSSGNRLWLNIYVNGFTNSPYGITLDSIGNGAFTGAILFSSIDDGDYYTVKFDSAGTTFWQRTYNGPVNYVDYGSSVMFDKWGNTYVTGSSWGNDLDYLTIKYNQQGDTLWTRRYNGAANGYDNVFSLCLDSADNCYVTGSSIGLGSGEDCTTIKYSPAGTQLWLVRYNGIANSDEGGGSIFIGNNNSVYVGGESVGIGTGKDLFVIKYNQPIGIFTNKNEIPNNFALYQNYPNPFNGTTVINYEIPVKSNLPTGRQVVQLKVYNTLGQLVKTLVNAEQSASYYTIIYNTEGLSSGVYFYSLVVNNNVKVTKKFILTK